MRDLVLNHSFEETTAVEQKKIYKRYKRLDDSN
jgi:hypothetical protein